MGSLLKWVGNIWALLGIVNLLYGLIEVVPRVTSSLNALFTSTSQYGQSQVHSHSFPLSFPLRWQSG